MSHGSNPVISGYSSLAAAYDSPANLESCWGTSTERILGLIRLKDSHRRVADVGCGTGQALVSLAERAPSVRFFGIEPAAPMLERAAIHTGHLPNVALRQGAFESIPLVDATIDYLYSIYAFHWASDPAKGVAEIRRVLMPDGEMDLFFVGPGNGAEFNKVTTPIMRRYMGRAYMLTAGKMQRQISRDAAVELFGQVFRGDRLTVEETYETHYDTLDGHWGWRVRIEGHFSGIPADRRADFDLEVREGLRAIATDRGIPYTIHRIHVNLKA